MNQFIGIGNIVEVNDEHEKVLKFRLSIKQGKKPCYVACVLFDPDEQVKEFIANMARTNQFVWLQGRIASHEFMNLLKMEIVTLCEWHQASGYYQRLKGETMWNTPSKERLARVPGLYETEHVPLKEKEIHFHFFFADCDWFCCEYSQEEDIFFGFAILNNDYQNAEWGYVSLAELKSIHVSGFEVDCDLHWQVRKASEIEKICKAQDW